MENLENLGIEDLKQVMSQCYLDTAAFSRVLFPDRFDRPFSSLHKEIFDPLDDESIQKLVIVAPRGWGKTSTINFSYPAKRILFRDKKFIVPISCTATQAVLQSENLKMELKANDRVQRMFGDVSLTSNNEGEAKRGVWSKDMWVANGETFIMPRGAGQQVRGILYKNSRPDLILIDDLEDAESVRSEEQRAKLKEWFFADVCNSIARDKKDWRIIVIGTILHEDSLLANLLQDPEWHSVELSICDDDYNSNWPEYISTEEIKKLAESYRRQGLLDVFYREYRNIPVSKEDAAFKSEHVKHYKESDLGDRKGHLENFVIVDPAKTVKVHSAETAILGVGVDLEKQKIYLRDLVAAKLHPDEILNEAFDMCERLGARTLGIEVTSLNEFITYPIRNEMLKRGKFLELVELKPRDSKENRAKSLVPLYRMGYIYHNADCMGSLEAQLFSFPRPKRWDCIDCAAYIIEMLERGGRYFFSADLAKDEGDLEFDKALEDEYAELPNEPSMGDEWQFI